MNYIEIRLWIEPLWAEIIMAEMGEINYESFTEEPDGINAYIVEDLFSEEELQEIIAKYADMTEIRYERKIIEKQNWNEVWEQNYEPIEVAGRCRVRASFHEPKPEFEYEIEITPKMSFGTGHHETTSMVLEIQLDLDQANKHVLDVGCGTGILAIMAEKRGATQISAFDIEEWAAENSRENAEINQCKYLAVRQGTIEDEPTAKYDIVLANINRNILLRDIPKYVEFMADKCTLVVSGFYENDIEDIEEVANENGLTKTSVKTKNNWAAVVFER
jgi:ribosomal protein L11 methyltransferase